MKIARYWARGEAQAVCSDEAPIELSIWRWSDSSQQDAQQRALGRDSLPVGQPAYRFGSQKKEGTGQFGVHGGPWAGRVCRR